MGTFLTFQNHYQIPQNEWKLFFDRMMKLFQEGGILQFEEVEIYGKRISLLHTPEPNQDGIVFADYSYYEDRFWETIGFDRQGHFFSGKVGTHEFFLLAAAAALLTEQMSQSKTLVNFDGWIGCWTSAAWINGCLDMELSLTNRKNAWNIYQILSQEKGSQSPHLFEYRPAINSEFLPCSLYACFMQENYSDILKSVSDILAHHKEPSPYLEMLKEAERLPGILKNLKQLKGLTDHVLMKSVLNYLCMDNVQRYQQYKDTDLPEKTSGFALCEAWLPAPLIVKALAEVTRHSYDEIWDTVCLKANSGCIYQLEQTIEQKSLPVYPPLSTEDYFSISCEDMLYQISPDQVSPDVEQWLREIKMNWEKEIESGSNPMDYASFLHDIITVMYEANQHFGNIFMFRQTFYDLLAHAQEKEYQAFWQIWKILIKKEWDRSSEELRESRIKLRMYLALLANSKLRTNVFGI